jgi:hypothetical protein
MCLAGLFDFSTTASDFAVSVTSHLNSPTSGEAGLGLKPWNSRRDRRVADPGITRSQEKTFYEAGLLTRFAAWDRQWPMSGSGPFRRSLRRQVMSEIEVSAQPVDATQALNLSAGVSNVKVFRGRSFS